MKRAREVPSKVAVGVPSKVVVGVPSAVADKTSKRNFKMKLQHEMDQPKADLEPWEKCLATKQQITINERRFVAPRKDSQRMYGARPSDFEGNKPQCRDACPQNVRRGHKIEGDESG
jgi:hypothetical protein